MDLGTLFGANQRFRWKVQGGPLLAINGVITPINGLVNEQLEL